MSSDRPVLLVFCDSLSYYGPTGGLPSDDPRIWPNIVASQLGWDLELIGRIGWTCRDVWWAATQDPRSWAALPKAGAVIFATCGMDSLPSPLPGRANARARCRRRAPCRRSTNAGVSMSKAMGDKGREKCIGAKAARSFISCTAANIPASPEATSLKPPRPKRLVSIIF